MSKKVTMLLEDYIDKKIRILQAKLIKDYVKSTSFSSVINDLLDKSLK